MPFVPTSSASPNPLLSSNAPVSPTSGGGGQYDALFDNSSWLGDSFKSIDAMRHFGGLGMAGLQDEFKGQLGDVQGGIDVQRQQRSILNELGSPAGRQKRVAGMQNDALARAKEAGKKLRSSILARTGQDIGGAADLFTTNQAMMQTGEFANWLESPQGQQEIASALMQINSPDQIVSLMRLLSGFDEQDFRRVNLHEQLAAQDAGGDFGKVLGVLGQLGGMTTGMGGAKRPSSLLLGNGQSYGNYTVGTSSGGGLKL